LICDGSDCSTTCLIEADDEEEEREKGNRCGRVIICLYLRVYDSHGKWTMVYESQIQMHV